MKEEREKKNRKKAYAIEIKGLTKKYGDLVAVNKLSLQINQGEIFGFLGPNGAGKSTTIRVLMDQISKQGGDYSLLGIPSSEITPEIYKDIGYVSGEAYLYENYTGDKLFNYFSSFDGFDSEKYKEYADLFKLDLSKKVNQLSSGNRQKVALIQALMKEPKLLILDEPTTGLDPILQKEFYQILDEFKEAGGTVFFSSHIMSEVERVCDRVGIIRKGKLVRVSTMDVLNKELSVHDIRVETTDNTGILSLIKKLHIEEYQHNGNKYQFVYRGGMQTFVQELAKLQIIDLIVEEPSLEQVFLNFYDENGE